VKLLDYLETAKKEIREVWFKDHVAELSGEKGLQVLNWRKKGTFMYAVKYVFSGNHVFISGDTGEAVYTLTFPAMLEELRDCDLYYFTGKLTAFCEERWDFDDKTAQKELDDYKKDWDMNDETSRNVYDQVSEAISESYSMENFHIQLSIAYEQGDIHSDDMEWMWHLGERLPYRLIGYWIGIQMAAEQLLDKKKQTA
jgi:hypothetical protein